MYEIISGIIDHSWSTGSSEQQYIYYICGALIIMSFCVITDLIYRIFAHFWRA